MGGLPALFCPICRNQFKFDSHEYAYRGIARQRCEWSVPSSSMGVTIQFESHKVELWAIHVMDYENRCSSPKKLRRNVRHFTERTHVVKCGQGFSTNSGFGAARAAGSWMVG